MTLNQSINSGVSPTWVAPTLLILFSILWGVWLLPHTVFIRHTAMILGAILGLYICVTNYHFFLKRHALSIHLIILLFAWVTYHLFFVGTDYEVQRNEYIGLWKKAMLCTPFAIGMGIAVAQTKKINTCWNIFYLGLTLPVLIYFIKWIITNNPFQWGIENPHLLLNSNHTQSHFGVSRALYPFFCLPSFIVGVFIIIKNNNVLLKKKSHYFVSILLTPILFYIEGDRTGLLLTSIILFIGVIIWLYNCRLHSYNSKIIGIVLIIFTIVTFYGLSKKFDQYKYFFSNAIIAIDIKNHDEWKYQGAKGYPTNHYEKTVDVSTYLRISWAIAGFQLLQENPMGYGLLTTSFDRLSKPKWENSNLGLTHSGWIDFGLGYGFMGLLILLSASFVAWSGGFLLIPYYWKVTILWAFGFLNIVFLMKELSYEVTVNAFIFFIMFIGAFLSSLPTSHNTTKELL